MAQSEYVPPPANAAEWEQLLEDAGRALFASLDNMVEAAQSCKSTGGDAAGVLTKLIDEQIGNGGDPGLWMMLRSMVTLL